MRAYLRTLLFFGLTVIEGIINFCCAVFGCYPALDFSTKFLVFGEIFRVRREIEKRVSDRQSLESEANEKVALAKQLDNG